MQKYVEIVYTDSRGLPTGRKELFPVSEEEVEELKKLQATQDFNRIHEFIKIYKVEKKLDRGE